MRAADPRVEFAIPRPKPKPREPQGGEAVQEIVNDLLDRLIRMIQ